MMDSQTLRSVRSQAETSDGSSANPSMTSVGNPLNWRRLTRWAIRAILLLLVLVAVVGLALPWAVEWPVVQAKLRQRIGQSIAPGELVVQRVTTGWFTPTVFHDVQLVDAQGQTLMSGETLVWDRKLFYWLFDRHPSRRGTITLAKPTVQIERRADGTVDLSEALAPLDESNSRVDFGLKVESAKLTYRDALLAEPIVSPKVDLEFHRLGENSNLNRYSPRIQWSLRIHQGQENRLSLQVDGDLPYDADLVELVQASFDPEVFDLRQSHQNQGLYTTVGYYSFEPSRIDIEARDWQMALRPTDGRESPIPVHLDGETGLDFASYLDDFGTWQMAWRWGGNASIREYGDPNLDPNLVPCRVEWDLSQDHHLGSVYLDRLTYTSGLATLRAEGIIDVPVIDSKMVPIVDVGGTWVPEWSSLTEQIDRATEGQLVVAGSAGRFELGGRVDFDHPEALQGRLELFLDRIAGAGIEVGPATWTLLWDGERATLPRVETTLNEGRLIVAAEATPQPEGGWRIRLDPESRIDGAIVNDQVSQELLAFVAPVLNQATRVNGKVSAIIDRAEWPLDVPGQSGGLVEGSVLFDEVSFKAGPLVELTLSGVRQFAPGTPEPKLTLDEPVLLRIAEDRVYHNGLTLPIAEVSQIAFSGEVGFDRSLVLDARVPILGNYLKESRVMNRLARGTEVTVPIRGTLDDPRLDGQILGQHLRDLSREMLGRGAVVGTLELLRLLGGDPQQPGEQP